MRYSIETIGSAMDTGPINNERRSADQGDRTYSVIVERRRIERIPVRIRGVLYHREHFQTTTIENISTGGAGLNGAVGVVPGNEVTIRLINGRELSGEVVWWLAGRCGISFHAELDANDPLFRQKRSQFS